MKYSDIPKLTSHGSYHVNVEVLDLKANIDRYVYEYGCEVNPDFQRGHVWTEAQQKAYIEYVLRGGLTGKDFYFNHPGWMSSFKGQMVLVDGLQRLTALLKFLNNEISIFDNVYCKDIDRLPSSLSVSFHVNNLKTRKEVLQWYLEFNSGGTPHSQEELDRVAELLKGEK